MINTFSFGSYILVYNGQIYNTKELSETLKENGFTLNSHSDTEVLLKSYIHYGKNVVNHLNGIFAFAIWDTNNNEIFLARDHFGVKPLFYTKIDETLNTYSHMYQNRLVTIVNIIELQNSRLNNNIIETKSTILLEHKETLPEPEDESYDYEDYEIVKHRNKDDLVL